MAVYEIDWYRSPLDPVQLKNLNERSDLLGFLQAGGYLAAIIATGVLAYICYLKLSWPWVVAAVFLHGTVGAFMINAVHELVHGTVFKTRWLNTTFAQIFGFLGWHNHYLFWCSHSEHHKFTLHAPDDLEVVLPLSHDFKGFIKTGLVAPLAMKFFIPYHFRIARGKFGKGWETQITTAAPPAERRKVILWSRFILAGHLGVILLSVFTGHWLIAVLVSLLPCYGGWLLFLCNNTQHTGLVDRVPDFRLCCRTILINPVARFLYWHMNFHIEHHMYAGVPCYRLGRLHKTIEHDLPPCPNGLLAAWAQILHIAARQKVDPTYQYVQPLPGHASANNELPVPRSIASPDASVAAAPVRPVLNSRGQPLRRWQCSVCGFVYDEALGLLEEGIAAGTAWEDIPDDWSCPDCGVAKSDFDMVPIIEGTDAMDMAANEELADVVKAPQTALVIIGSGLAGYSLAKEIRSLGITRPLTILTRDAGQFYSKPMLSNALAEKLTPATLVKNAASEMAERFQIEVRPNVLVQRIDRERSVVITDAGEFPYGQLVLGVGADQIMLPIGGDGAGLIHQVNDLASYAEFHSQLTLGCRVAIIGAGLIGCEFANDLINGGFKVEVIDIAERPLARLAPAAISEALQQRLAALGVTWHLAASVQSVSRTEGRLCCQLADGQHIEADVVLSAVGLKPRINLAQAAGLKVNRGIVVDSYLRSSDANIFAIGDCAEVNGQVMPYIHPIFESIHALAHTLGGEERRVEYPAMPVVVKTPACPMVICPPAPGVQGNWTVQGDGADLCSLFHDESGASLLGFALCGAAISRRTELTQRISKPAAMAAATAEVMAPGKIV